MLVAAVVNGCAATSSPTHWTEEATTEEAATAAAATTAAATADAATADAATADAPTADAPTESCSECKPAELCDPAHLGFDDNCNGLVDEGCTCSPGSVHWCFKGEPSYRGTPGCFDGTETCTELGLWGPCVGGVQATDNCFVNNSSCQAITALPGAVVDLMTGTGTFSADAVPGSETYTVTCPSGISKCPAVTAPESFSEIQSGEYTVTYTKMVADDPNPHSCTFPLLIGARGLRVELTWEHNLDDRGVDLDLHLHQPVNTAPWAVSPGEPQDCTWSSCKVDQILNDSPAVPVWSPIASD
jgi:hypothetical protein